MARNQESPQISNAEWEVMKVLWENGPMAARDVIGALPESIEWAPKTVKTLLSRLVAKGALCYEQYGNSYVYRAACRREQVTRHEVRGFVDRVLDGAITPLVAHFLEERTVSDEELAKLRKLLDQHGKGRKTK